MIAVVRELSLPKIILSAPSAIMAIASSCYRKISCDRFSAFAAVALMLPLLFIPKVNFLQITGQTAGIRFDDIWLLCGSLLLLWGRFASSLQIDPLELSLLATIAFSLFSFLVNQLFFNLGLVPVEASIFYCLRVGEYFLFFYLGSLAARFLSSKKMILVYLAWNLLLISLQKAQWLGIFTSQGYQSIADDRMLGVASFGAEMGMLLNFFFAFLLCDSKPTGAIPLILPLAIKRLVAKLYPFVLLVMFVFLTTLTGARIAIGATLLIFIWYRPSSSSPLRVYNGLITLATLAIGGGVAVYALNYHSKIIERSRGLLSFDNLNLIGAVWQKISLEYVPIGRELITSGGVDSSWWMRLHKWCYALKLFCYHPYCWLQGVGPGFAMAALDGGYIRLLCEVGIIGSLLYYRFFYQLAMISPQLKAMMVAFAVNMLFFDSYLSYKSMSFLFLIAGIATSERGAQPVSSSRYHIFLQTAKEKPMGTRWI